MATAITIPPDTRPIPPFPVKRFTLTKYHEMARLGVLGPEDRVELLDGWLVPKVTLNPPHASAVSKLYRRLTQLLGDDWVVRGQQPITLGGANEPEPDLAIVAGPEDRYDTVHPVSADVALVVEVADSSLPQDRNFKLPLYAANRIAVYWIVNLLDGVIEVYARPRAGRNPTYRSRTDYRPGDAVPVVLAGHELGSIAAAEVLP